MTRTLLIGITVVVVIAVAVASSVALSPRTAPAKFGFPPQQDVNQLLQGTFSQTGMTYSNITEPGMLSIYGLISTETAVYNISSTAGAYSHVYLVELQFNSTDSSVSFYRSQLFGNMLVLEPYSATTWLNMTHNGVTYSAFNSNSSYFPFHYAVGYKQSFAFTILVDTGSLPAETLASLASMVTGYM